MEPAPTLYSEGREVAKRPKSYFPLTTQGKIALAAWREQNPNITPRERPPPSDKPRSLPPPGELTEIDKMLNLKKLVSATKPLRDYRKNKPVTTQEKIIAAKALERARGGGHGKNWRPSKAKIPGLATQARMLDNRKSPSQPSSRDNLSVLVRKTKRSEQWARRQYVDDEIGWSGTFPLVDLPREIRSKIWKLVVVEESVFIWPETPTGQEQPDLAMTCRAIREEVLPIFYGINTFGVVISPAIIPPPSGKDGNRAEQMSGVAAVRKWASALEDKGNESGIWMQQIRHWAFQYTDAGVSNSQANIGGRSQSQNFLVLVDFNNWVTTETYKPAEVHQEAACVLPGWREFGACSPGQNPKQVDALVRSVQQAAWKNQATRTELISMLALQFRELKDQLVRAKCHRSG